MENTTEYPIKYHCTVIQEEITAHSIKELTDKLEKLGFNETSAINIKAEIFGLVKVPAECEA
jgi:Fe2+ transport system protein FeoA